MKLNPVYLKESKTSSRTVKTAVIILLFNGVLAAVAFLNLYSMVESLRYTGEVQFSSMLELYMLIAEFEFAMLLLVMPALTSGSISGERERQTLDLLLSTNMRPRQIIIGKLLSALEVASILILSTFPILSLVFIYGGLKMLDLFFLYLYFLVTAFFVGSIGIMFSSVFKKTMISTVVSYLTEVVLLGGSYLIVYFAKQVSDIHYSTDIVAEQTGAGGAVYLLITNPGVNFYSFINQQAGNRRALKELLGGFFNYSENFFFNNWVTIGIVLQIAVAVVCIYIAVKAIDPGRKRF